VKRWLGASWIVVGLLTAGSVGVVACVDDSTEPSPSSASEQVECSVGQPVVDPALLAFLSKAKAAHHRADIAEDDEDGSGAVTQLEALVNGPRPKADSAEVREVLADTLARLAELRSADGDFEDAMKDVDHGLKLAQERTHFRGRLKEVQGVVHQRFHKQLLADGNESKAAQQKAAAIHSFEAAIEIQDEVIKRALDDSAAGAPPPAP
jgi:hypothetical protein